MPRSYATPFLSGSDSLAASFPPAGAASDFPPLTGANVTRPAGSSISRFEAAVWDVRSALCSAASGMPPAPAFTGPTVYFVPRITCGTGNESITRHTMCLRNREYACHGAARRWCCAKISLPYRTVASGIDRAVADKAEEGAGTGIDGSRAVARMVRMPDDPSKLHVSLHAIASVVSLILPAPANAGIAVFLHGNNPARDCLLTLPLGAILMPLAARNVTEGCRRIADAAARLQCSSRAKAKQ